MFDETGEETLIQQQPVKKQSLLKKYDISLDKLSFEYVAECKNVKELERIVKILRSGEEGFYEELQKQAEKRLEILAPNNRILRKEELIVMKDSLIQSERDEVDNDMKQWETEISSKDLELADWNKNCITETGSGDYIPPVRRVPEKKGDVNKKQIENTKNVKKPMMSDYATWDKYDVDSELLKMDAEEERKKEEDEIKERRYKALVEAEVRRKEQDRLQDIIKSSKTMPDAEKCCLALREKDRGNEYYKTCNYDDAIDYYTASIAICPNAVSFNNRAASYLKQGKYDLALTDVNKCLELEPENTKGLYRRGLCLQHKNRFDEALEDMQTVLRKEPHNLLVQHVAKELRQQCRSVPRSVRMLVEEQQEDKVVEVTEAEAKGMKDGFEVNEWGLARTMCGCYGRPQFMRNPETAGIAEHLIYKPEDDKRKKKKMDGFDDNRVVESAADRSSLSKICMPIIEPICNGNVDTNLIVSKSDSDDEAEDESLPKKIKIIETVKLNSSPSSSTMKEASDKPKKGVVVKDMRGQMPRIKGQGKNESDIMEQFGNITIGESVTSTQNPTNESTHEMKAKKTVTKQKNQSQNNANNNKDNNERNKQESQSNASHRRPARNYVFHEPSEKQSIPIATKYTTQKVTSNRNANINVAVKKDDVLLVPSTSSPEYCIESQSNNNSNNNNYSSNNINENNSIPISPNIVVSEKEAITPFQFFQLWSSIKDTKTCLKEYADVLRRISPARLRAILGNKLDGTMLVTMIKSLANEFDITNDEGDLVKQYLVSISSLDRFQIVVEFLSTDIKRLLCGLIEKVGGDEKTELKKAYLIAQE